MSKMILRPSVPDAFSNMTGRSVVWRRAVDYSHNVRRRLLWSGLRSMYFYYIQYMKYST